MSNQDESELELTVNQSAALLRLEITFLNMAESSYVSLSHDGKVEVHAKQSADGIAGKLQQIITENQLPYEAYESLIGSYVGKLRDNFRSSVVEASIEGRGGANNERARKLEFLTSLYVGVLEYLCRIREGVGKIKNLLHEIAPYSTGTKRDDIDDVIGYVRKIVGDNRLPAETYIPTVKYYLELSTSLQRECITNREHRIKIGMVGDNVFKSYSTRLETAKRMEKALIAYLDSLNVTVT